MKSIGPRISGSVRRKFTFFGATVTPKTQSFSDERDSLSILAQEISDDSSRKGGALKSTNFWLWTQVCEPMVRSHQSLLGKSTSDLGALGPKRLQVELCNG